MNTPIKPCPRCGMSWPELEEVEGLWMGFFPPTPSEPNGTHEILSIVSCLNCGFRAMAGEDDEHAIKLWNDEPDLSGKPAILRDQVLSYLLGSLHTENLASKLDGEIEWTRRDPTILIRYEDEADAFVARIYLKETK